ncbi:Bifunctional inhibitor/lipid-transfer protein/seed storage 2S albumin superfamily protein [Hirschfeldia incana]|nr:Bifunctional inhibitor/lipid-transfer protein/seed storage 2S albumin superfamily protein [Hirschfeldia incana]
MKTRKSQVLTVIVLMVLVEPSLVKEATAHPCGQTFLSALIQLVPCTLSVVPFSTLSPNEPCCSAIKTLGQPCLCVIANGPSIPGVDHTLALQLPGKCSANFPPCN